MKVDRWSTVIEVEDVTNQVPFNILWKKTFIVNHLDGQSQIQLTKRIRGSFYGTVLFPPIERNWIEDENSKPAVQQPNFSHWSENEVYEMCTEWITQNLGGDFSV